MRKIISNIADWIGALAIYSAMAFTVGMIVLYVVGLCAIPIALVWAIYKLVTYYAN